MLLSSWKSENEIQWSLGNKQRIAVFACNFCANLNDTGGKRGLGQIKRLLKNWGKDIVVAKTVNGCCSEEVMQQSQRLYIEPVKESCDALLMLSCASGVKCAYLCKPGIPVVAALDSIGSGVVSTTMKSVDVGICSTCGHCVLTWTHGICPITECPAKKKYGPCKNSPKEGNTCVIETDQECIWKKIEKYGDISALKELSKIHTCNDYKRVPAIEFQGSPTIVRRLSGYFMARMPNISWLVDMLR